MGELDVSKLLPEAYFFIAFRALSGKRFRFLRVLRMLRLALNALEGGESLTQGKEAGEARCTSQLVPGP